MQWLNTEKIYFLSVLTGIFLIAWHFQFNILISTDVNWTIHITQRLLEKRVYLDKFFETNFNPPMIFYLSLPPILLMKFFEINLPLALHIYIFFLASLSLLICFQLLKKIFSQNENKLVWLFLCALAVIFLLLPVNEFGQRDHLLLILTMPYILLISSRLQDHVISRSLATLIGLLAGLGFSIKPHFFATFLLLELYYFFKLIPRSRLAWLRTESITILFILSIYTLSTIVIYQIYFEGASNIIPSMLHLYYLGMGVSSSLLVFFSFVPYCALAALFYFIQFKNDPHKTLNTVLLIVLVGSLFSYFAQRTIWYYHVLPAFSIAFLLFVSLFGRLVLDQHQLSKRSYFVISLFAVVVGYFLFYYINLVKIVIVLDPLVFFIFFIVLFVTLSQLMLSEYGFLQTIIKVFLLSSISYYFYYLVMHTPYPVFSLTLILVFLLMGALAPKTSVSKIHFLFYAGLATLLFVFPYYTIYDSYLRAIYYKNGISKLTDFVRLHAENQPVYSFSTTPRYAYTAASYANATLPSRFECLTFLPGILKQSQSQYPKEKDFFINAIAEELNIYKPKLVLVDTKRNKEYLSGMQFDYLPYFSQNTAFELAWKSYRYLDRIEKYPLYQFDIYYRVN